MIGPYILHDGARRQITFSLPGPQHFAAERVRFHLKQEPQIID